MDEFEKIILIIIFIGKRLSLKKLTILLKICYTRLFLISISVMSWKQVLPSTLLLVLCLLLAGMGVWQLDRAKQKQNILDAEAKAQLSTAMDCQDLTRPQPWQKCRLRGKLQPERLYLDNQFSGHELGYGILGLVQLSNGQHVLVDMGWISLGADRQHLPRVDLPAYHDWQGQVYYPSEAKFKLGGLVDRQIASNYVIERLDPTAIAKLLKQPILPWILRMSLQQSTGLKQEWKLVSVLPERHYAYASQWFSMAAVVLMILIWRMVKACKKNV
jgi:surfeit locus 1 family protein